MYPSQALILALIATPLLILGRDAFNRRGERRALLLAAGLLAAILVNVAVTVSLRR